ncbi:MAG: iron-sulfur cluster assembly protein [Promethearchaeota archaeon]
MSVTVDDIREAIKDVRHPEIDNTLVNLGIIKDIKIDNGKIIITLNLPFPQVPDAIVNIFMSSINPKLQKFNMDVIYLRSYMTKEELDRFLKLEKEGWML